MKPGVYYSDKYNEMALAYQLDNGIWRFETYDYHMTSLKFHVGDTFVWIGEF